MRNKNKFFKTLSAFALVIAMTVSANSVTLRAEINANDGASSESGEEFIERLFDVIDQKDWNTFTDLMIDSEKNFYENYFNDDSITNGVKQVEAIAINNIYTVDSERLGSELLTSEYPILASSNTILSYIVEADCSVNKENQFFYNGINYFLVVVVGEGEGLKMAQFNRPSSELVHEIVEPTLKESRGDISEQLAGINVLDMAACGLVVNADGEFITDGFEIVRVDEETGVSGVGRASDPSLNHFSYYSYPKNITVKMNKTGNDAIVTVAFDTYIKNVLPNEWMGRWESECLKAGAYCVKMVGWYNFISPASSTGGFHTAQSKQMYIPNTAQTATNNIINSIANHGMADHSGRIFYPEYAQGENGDRGPKACGQLKQYGSHVLAGEGYNYLQILNYYYSGSSRSSGDVVIFGYN